MEFLTTLEPKREFALVWDSVAPIVKNNDGSYSVFLTDNIGAPWDYNEIIYLLDNASSTDIIKFHINNGGGVVDSAFMIYDAVVNSAARCIARLSGTVASAATMITLACEELYVAPFTQFMVHNYSGGAHGKGHELADQIKFTNAELNRTFKHIYAGFLSTAEISSVIKGKDIWMGRDEVIDRFNKAKALR
jgi:ATP-dependent protease ClpP protease subunit